MKKRITCIICALLTFAMFAGGCGRDSKAQLIFNNAFVGGGGGGSAVNEPIPNAYTEVLEYEISYNPDGTFKKSDTLSDAVTCSFNGTYKSTLKAITEYGVEFESDLKAKKGETENLYKLTTEFTVNATYDFKDQSVTDVNTVDTITSEVYFFSYEQSYSPLYSKTVAKYSSLILGEQSRCAITEYERVVTYNSSSYTQASKSVQYYFGETDKALPQDYQTDTYGYAHKTVIDNAQLLFTLRNINLAPEASFTLPTTSINYNQATDLTVKNVKEYEETVTFNYNGEQKSTKMTLKELIYAVNQSKTAGTPQYLYVQAKAAEGVDYKALPIKYLQPLVGMAQGSYAFLGTLEYKLINAQIN